MKTFLILLLLSVSFNVFAETEKIEGPSAVIEFLLSPHPEFKQAYCVPHFIRLGDSDNDLYLAAGYYISKIEKTLVIGTEAVPTHYLINLFYSTANSIILKEPITFRCL